MNFDFAFMFLSGMGIGTSPIFNRISIHAIDSNKEEDKMVIGCEGVYFCITAAIVLPI